MLPASYLAGDYFYSLEDIEAENSRTTIVNDVDYAHDMCNWFQELTEQGVCIAIDTEFDDIDLDKENPIGRGTIITTQFTIENEERIKLWVDCRDKKVLEAFAPFLSNPARTKILHNYVIEYHIFANYGINLQGLYVDTLAMSRLCDPERDGGHGLDSDMGLAVGLAGRPRGSRPSTKQALGTNVILKKGDLGKRIEFMGMRKIVEDPEMLPFQMFYACNDTLDTLDLKNILIPMLGKIDWNEDPRGLFGLYEDFYREYQEVLAKLMRRGICVDLEYLEVVKEEFINHMTDLRGKFNEWAGCEVNLDSPPQIGWLLYGEGWRGITKANIQVYGHGLPIPDGRPKDKNRKAEFLGGEDKFPSADANAREFLLENTQGDDLEAIKNLTEYSKHDTIVTLTINSMLKTNISRHATGYREYDPYKEHYRYVHGSFDIATATGRLSSAKPNLQQIPSRGRLGVITKHAFTCEEGEIMVVGDWSQVELRLLAFYAKTLCGDTSLAEDLREGDLHKNTAIKLSKLIGREVERVVAKAVNFGINYGATANKLSYMTGISITEAEEVIRVYLEELYPGINLYADTMIAYAREHGHVRTLLGRIRVLRNIQSRNGKLRSSDERRARNTPIQGSAQDVCMVAMNLMERDPELLEYGYEMRIPVHDEIVGVTNKPQYEKEIITRVKFIMENTIPVEMLDGIPLIADVHSGTTWQEAKSGEAFTDLSKMAS